MEIKGDFLSFQFGGKDCAELGIVRTSDGDRIEEQLHPEIKDITAEVPGMNGEYYFGSTYGNKTISVSFAFDDMTEDQLRQLRRHFAVGQIQDLIFSERPYKRYQAKIASPIELSYVCFDAPVRTVGAERDGVRRITTTEQRDIVDPETGATTTETYYARDLEQVTPYEYDYTRIQRVYKGEGKIEFVCYFPFAKSCYKTLPSKGTDVYTKNVDEWAESSGILSEAEHDSKQIDTCFVDGGYDEAQDKVDYIYLHNPGDVKTGFKLYCPFVEGDDYSKNLVLIYRVKNNPDAEKIDDRWQEITRLTLGPITKLNSLETGFLIDTNTGLITGVIQEPTEETQNNGSYVTDGVLYNQFVKNGQFFKIEPANVQTDDLTMIAVINGKTGTQIFYDYLYF